MLLDGKRVLITGGTGSLGHALVRRLLTGNAGHPDKIIIFSRDEVKQDRMRQTYWSSRGLLTFRIGDVRNYPSVLGAVQEADVIFHAAALKQVPACEYFPHEAVLTNIEGTWNVVRAVQRVGLVEWVVATSSDKACKPVSVYGMTKAVQERIFVNANRDCPTTRFLCVRYGNIIVSRGSVIPLFLKLIRQGGPVTVTLKQMTRFFLSLDRAVDALLAAARTGLPGEIYVPQIQSAYIVDVAKVLIGERNIPIVYTGARPGEKVNETLVAEEECSRTIERDGYYAICPALPELRQASIDEPALTSAYGSAGVLLSYNELQALLANVVQDDCQARQELPDEHSLYR